MMLKVTINEDTYPMDIPADMISGAEDLFRKMDEDMDRGWQMSRKWVDRPDIEQRCRIVADKMLTAIENGNERIAAMMAAYILNRLPGIEGLDIDTEGDINQTELIMGIT
ncbi:MAG: hypothetical protein LJE91_10760 [Gammaproteobacteria bacterium]|jgi:hypothetical protein|nr:hypothetical protein [Gammaproteobacteria bacterium]